MSGVNLAPGETSISRIVQAIRKLMEGRDNASGAVNLSVSSATTTVSAPNCSSVSEVFLNPTSTSAAAEVAAGQLFVSAKMQAQFVISHTNTTITTRSFDWTTRG